MGEKTDDLGCPTIIFCGAGFHAIDCIDRWLTEGLNGVCFAEIDKSKYYKRLGGLEIIPLDEAISRYPDYVLYLTQGYENLLPVTNDLIRRGIPRERIKYADLFEWRKGCDYMGRHISFGYKSFYICCSVDYRHNISRTESVEIDILKAQKYTDDLINNLRNGNQTLCDKCPLLLEGIWEKQPELRTIGLTSDFAQVICNFKCLYCNSKDWLIKSSDKIETPLELLYKLYNVVKCKNAQISLATGEPTICPWISDMLAFLHEKRWYTKLSTNASYYNDKIPKMQKDCILNMIVSIDAGTCETFARIKGIDCWDKVIANLVQYAEAGCGLQLKYVILDGINDNESDIIGFIKLCKQLNVDAILSANIVNQKPLTSSMVDACLLLADKAKESKIKVYFTSNHFLPSDCDRLERYFKINDKTEQEITSEELYIAQSQIWELTRQNHELNRRIDEFHAHVYSNIDERMNHVHQRIEEFHGHIYPYIEERNNSLNQRMEEICSKLKMNKHSLLNKIINKIRGGGGG